MQGDRWARAGARAGAGVAVAAATAAAGVGRAVPQAGGWKGVFWQTVEHGRSEALQPLLQHLTFA